MDKALKSTLIWTSCGIIIVGLVILYSSMKNNNLQDNRTPDLFLKTEAVIVNISTVSEENSQIILNYTDEKGKKFQSKIAISSMETNKNAGDTIHIYYNLVNPNEISLTNISDEER